MRFSQKVTYGVGHILNDICSAVWFSYTLLYFRVVLGMSQSLTGSLLLIGQVVDAFATPVIGISADRSGRIKLWHLAGTIGTIVSFPLIFVTFLDYFNYPIQDGTDEAAHNNGSLPTWMSALYYTILIVVFQIAWAVVQISHLALLPILTPVQSERADLTAIRFSASICSSIFMYLVTWLILHMTTDKRTILGADDGYKFRDIVLIGLVVGGAFSALFHIFLKVPDDMTGKKSQKCSEKNSFSKSSFNVYLKSPMLYQVSLLYVSSRLFLTLSLVYMPLYLVENAGEETEFLATVPLVSYIASFVSSLIVKHFNSGTGSKLIYLVGGIASLLGCLWIGIGLGRFSLAGELFSVATLLGTGSSLTMVSSLCLTADFIGTKTEHGAFVYSVVTFADKLLNGVVVMLIEELKYPDSPDYYQSVLAYVCGATVFIGVITLLSISIHSVTLSRLKEALKIFR